MNPLWITAGVPAAVAIATALYTTGGRAALARRAIKADLEIANALPVGHARDVVTAMAEEKTVLYAGRWVGPKKPTAKQHLYFSLVAGASVSIAWSAGQLGNVVDGNLFLGSISLLLLVLGLGVCFGAVVAWGVLILASDNAQLRLDSINVGRERIARRLVDQDEVEQEGKGIPAETKERPVRRAGNVRNGEAASSGGTNS